MSDNNVYINVYTLYQYNTEDYKSIIEHCRNLILVSSSFITEPPSKDRKASFSQDTDTNSDNSNQSLSSNESLSPETDDMQSPCEDLTALDKDIK